MKSISEKMITGEFFENGSSRANRSKILIEKKVVSVFRGSKCIYRQIAIDSVQDGRNIFLQNGSLFIADDQLTANHSKFLTSTTEGWLSAFDQLGLKTLTILLAIIVILILGYRYALVTFSPTIVKLFPYEWEKQIGKTTFDSLNRTLLDETELPTQRVNTLKQRAKNVLNQANLHSYPSIEFMKSDIIGANALALPGGPIIVTDDLVKLLKDDELVLGVIAHEIAHIQERHSLHQIVEIVGLSSLAWLIFGLDEGILEEVALVGINLWSLKKSRDFEKDSDLLALEFLENAGLKKKSFILAIEKLTEHFCSKSKLDKSDCLTGVKSGWLATHPTGAERLKYLREKID